MKGIKLSEWAKSKGLTYKGAYRLFRVGKLPCRSEQLPTGTIIVYPEEISPGEKKVAIYARVSSSDQKEDLQRQVERLRSFCANRGLRVSKEVSEIGSGLNGKRKRLKELLSDKEMGVIVVEHRDRLARFGVEYLESALTAHGRELLVINETENKIDLVQDFVDVVTSLCARIYGQRSARLKAQRALEATKE